MPRADAGYRFRYQASITSPVVLAKRTFFSPSILKPTRVGLPLASSSARLLRSIGIAFGMRPPWLVWLWRVWRTTMFTPSTTAFPALGSTDEIVPSLPLSLPARTTTLSPFFSLAAMSKHLRGERDDLHEV